MAEISYFQDFSANDTGILCYISDAAYTNKPLRYIIEYTKTMDEATIQFQESSQNTKHEMQEKTDHQDFTASVTAGI